MLDSCEVETQSISQIVEESLVGFWAHVGAPLQYMVKLVIRKEQGQARYYMESVLSFVNTPQTLTNDIIQMT